MSIRIRSTSAVYDVYIEEKKVGTVSKFNGAWAHQEFNDVGARTYGFLTRRAAVAALVEATGLEVKPEPSKAVPAIMAMFEKVGA